MDDGARIALIDTPTIIPSGSSEVQLLRYQFSTSGVLKTEVKKKQEHKMQAATRSPVLFFGP